MLPENEDEIKREPLPFHRVTRDLIKCSVTKDVRKSIDLLFSQIAVTGLVFVCVCRGYECGCGCGCECWVWVLGVDVGVGVGWMWV